MTIAEFEALFLTVVQERLPEAKLETREKRATIFEARAWLDEGTFIEVYFNPRRFCYRTLLKHEGHEGTKWHEFGSRWQGNVREIRPFVLFVIRTSFGQKVSGSEEEIGIRNVLPECQASS